MRQPNTPHGRGPQILKTLVQHGPLSTRGLSVVLEPPIFRVRLFEALERLCRRRLVVRLHPNLFRGAAVYYQINQRRKFWPEIAAIVGCSENRLHQPHFRSKELHHSEACAVWSVHFQKLFPNAAILRDYEIPSSKVALSLLSVTSDDRDFLPDLLLMLPNQECNGLVSVAIEVERFVKSENRLKLKLKKFANESYVDGVIYLCANDGIVDNLRRIYNISTKPQALRVNNYGDNFILFQDDIFEAKIPQLNLQNAAEKETEIRCWMRQLVRQKSDDRHDANFIVPYSRSGSLQNA